MAKILFPLVGGLTLFLFGMMTLSEGLEKAASAWLRSVLEKSVSSVFGALIVGIAVTSLVQSSSAMIALLVGFVNAGLVRLKQAISIVLGANIGTTLTAWIVSLIGVLALLKITHYTLPLIAIGLAVAYLFRTGRGQGYGRALMAPV